MKTTYFDSAATTQIHDEVIECMLRVMKNTFGNASSTHSYGRLSKSLIEQTRKTIANELNALPSEIIFTSGGTEANNLILRSAVRDLGVTEIITSRIEHHAVLNTIEQLKKEYGITISYVKLDTKGFCNYSHLEDLLKSPEKKLVSLMHINNEIGNINDIQRIGELCQKHETLFHSDTVQSVGHFKLDLQALNIDFLIASAHKFHGPKGVGFAFIRKNTGIQSLIFGGNQERGCRAGTEAIHNIVGLEKAFKMSYENLETDRNHTLMIKKYFIKKIREVSPTAQFNGACLDQNNSTYTLINVCLPIPLDKAPMLQFQLDLKGIACSKGSACQSGSTTSSHVLTEILSSEQLQQPSIRFSFSKYNKKSEVDYVVQILKNLVEDEKYSLS